MYLDLDVINKGHLCIYDLYEWLDLGTCDS